MLEQAAEELVAPDRAGRRRLEVAGGAERPIAFGLMRPVRVIEVNVALGEVPHVPLAEDDEVVEALVAEGLDPALGESIAVGRVRRQ